MSKNQKCAEASQHARRELFGARLQLAERYYVDCDSARELAETDRQRTSDKISLAARTANV